MNEVKQAFKVNYINENFISIGEYRVEKEHNELPDTVEFCGRTYKKCKFDNSFNFCKKAYYTIDYDSDFAYGVRNK